MNVHRTISIACFLNCPLWENKKKGHMTAMQDQSDGKVIRQITMIARILPHCGTLSF